MPTNTNNQMINPPVFNQMLDHRAAYWELWNAMDSANQQTISKVVMALFRAQNKKEKEHDEVDMQISRMCFVELISNKDPNDDLDEYLDAIISNPDAGIRIGMLLAQERAAQTIGGKK